VRDRRRWISGAAAQRCDRPVDDDARFLGGVLGGLTFADDGARQAVCIRPYRAQEQFGLVAAA